MRAPFKRACSALAFTLLAGLPGCVEVEEKYKVQEDGSVVIESHVSGRANASQLPTPQQLTALLDRIQSKLNSLEYSRRAIERKVIPEIPSAARGQTANGTQPFSLRVQFRYRHFLDLDPVGPVNRLLREEDPALRSALPNLPPAPSLRPLPSFPGVAVLAVEFPSEVGSPTGAFQPSSSTSQAGAFVLAGPSFVTDTAPPSGKVFGQAAPAGRELRLVRLPYGKQTPMQKVLVVHGLYSAPEFLFAVGCTVLGLLGALGLLKGLLLGAPTPKQS